MNNEPLPAWTLAGLDEQLEILASLTNEQRQAVKWAFKMWVGIATHHEYEPLRDWRNFGPEVDHSALFDRILRGKAPTRERPPTEHSYPVYPD